MHACWPGITTDDQYICKVKGYKNPKTIPFSYFKKLLIMSVPASRGKWISITS